MTPAFGPALDDLQEFHRVLKRDLRNFSRALQGLPPLAPDGALTLCEPDLRGALTTVPDARRDATSVCERPR